MALSLSDRELVSKKEKNNSYFHATLMVFKTQLILEMVPEFDLL